MTEQITSAADSTRSTEPEPAPVPLVGSAAPDAAKEAAAAPDAEPGQAEDPAPLEDRAPVDDAAPAEAPAQVEDSRPAVAAAVRPPLPQMPTEPPRTPPAMAPPSPRPPRRVLRAIARWTVALVVFGGLGTGAAFAVTGQGRDDLPGLATQDDGRWQYPRLSLPALAADAPRPFTLGNEGQIHYADLRKLLLPLPAGATQDKKLKGGWVPFDQYVSEFPEDGRPDIRRNLLDDGARHIAARGWTMPDGTSSRVYLLRFESAALAETYSDTQLNGVMGPPLATAPTSEMDEQWSDEEHVPDTTPWAFAETKPYGPTQARLGTVLAGDTLALIVQEKKGGAPAVPFHQALILQNQLLG
jgi:hypothetical protein